MLRNFSSGTGLEEDLDSIHIFYAFVDKSKLSPWVLWTTGSTIARGHKAIELTVASKRHEIIVLLPSKCTLTVCQEALQLHLMSPSARAGDSQIYPPVL